MSRTPPSFDLVVATVGRVAELDSFLDSVEAQEHPSVRVLLVDQNGDDRVTGAIAGRALEVVHLRSAPGLSRARNVGLEHARADLVAFPDDDCVYPPGLLERVARRFLADSGLDGLTGRAEDAQGKSSPSWKPDPAILTDENLWNRAISFTIFLRGGLVERIGAFDEQLGLGSSEPWSSGEEIDFLIRAIRDEARIEYDPTLVVRHDVRADDATTGMRDGASVGYLMRKHRYSRRVVARMLVRPVGGVAASLVRLDTRRARYHVASVRGRVTGLRAQRTTS